MKGQAYEYLPITTEAQLVANLRTRARPPNGITFSDTDSERFFGLAAGADDR